MGLMDKLRGTKRPPRGVEPCPAEDVVAALLGLNGPDVPWVVRDGTDEGADFVAEWRVEEPTWQSFFASRQVNRTLRIRLLLIPKLHEVQAIEEQWAVSWAAGPASASLSREWGRGPGRRVTKTWTIGRGSDGRLQATESYHFDSNDMKRPVQNAVLEAGWTWRGVLSKSF
ncbi:hypothetical protein J7E87_23970 [Streptomyces sp. ISL-1]|uniref:hypothetical protein n=1 Tax=Streptomyces sp. ISL-1 TaxID=2817657 RepID=UPI001BE719D0|nr:hypothetical protein [Streptomyces sp. ISL-1]MBT2392397.1 hypothetical protein [Streptomyces sp. ISL-1]